MEADQVGIVVQYIQLLHLPGKAQLSSAWAEETSMRFCQKAEPADSEEVLPHIFVGLII